MWLGVLPGGPGENVPQNVSGNMCALNVLSPCNSEGFPRPRIKNRRLGRERTGELRGSSFQPTGSPWEVPGGRSQGPTRRKATRQPRPGPAPDRARGSWEGLDRPVPSGSVPRARGRRRGPSTSPPGVTNGLGTQAHATFQPRAGLERADTPHSTPAKVGRSKGGPGTAPSDLRAVSQTPDQPSSHPNP